MMRQPTPEWIAVLLWVLGGIGFSAAISLWPKRPHPALWTGFFSVVLILLGITLYLRNGLIGKDRFHVRLFSIVSLNYFYRYRSSAAPGQQRLAWVDMISAEVTLRTSTPAKIARYTVDTEFEGRWVRLHNLEPLGSDELRSFFSFDLDKPDFSRVVQWDFGDSSFDAFARAQLPPIRGWIFLERPPDLPREFVMRAFRITLVDAEGRREVHEIRQEQEDVEAGSTSADYWDKMQRIGVVEIPGLRIVPMFIDTAEAHSAPSPSPSPSRTVPRPTVPGSTPTRSRRRRRRRRKH